MFSDEYQTIESLTEATIADRGSKFIAAVAPADSQQRVDELLERRRKEYPNAVEWVIAARLGLPDDVTVYTNGEGKFCQAVVKLFEGMQLTHIAAVICRDAPGKPAGPQSYHDAALNAIQHGKVVKRILYASIRFEVPPADMNLASRLVTDGRAKITHTQTGNPNVITVMIRKIQEDEIVRTLTSRSNGRIRRIMDE